MSILALRQPETSIAILPRVGPGDAYDALLTDAKCANTRAAREHDCRVFASFTGAPDSRTACAFLVSQGRGEANAVAMAFRASEQSRGSAPASINRRLATLRRLVALARRLGILEWALDVDDLAVETYRDTRGPGVDGWQALWATAAGRGHGQAARDRALLRVMHDNGLRCCEVIGLNYPEDVDVDGARLQIRGKGRGSKQWVTTSAHVVALLREWIAARGELPGPLFTSRTGKRLANNDVRRLIRGLASQAGIEHGVRPHGIRHHAITRCLDLNNGNVRVAQRFARHASPETTMRYDDNRRDLAGDVARQLGAD